MLPNRFDFIIGGIVALLIVLIAVSALLMPAAPASASGAKIAYLGPTAGPFNIMVVDPAQPGLAPQAITNSPRGIFDFSVSADGRYIAYSEQVGELEIAELFVIDLQTKAVQQLTDCAGQDAYCTTPIWRPDGKALAYQRVNLNTSLGLGPSAPRIWILDMSREQASTFQLFQNSDILGSDSIWSADGSKIAFYESTSQSVMVYDFKAAAPEDQAIIIPAGNGMVGSLSPDGTKLVFPEILPPGETIPARAVLRVADLTNQVITDLTPEEELTDDNVVAWKPDGTELALTRTYLDERYTRGFQVYSLKLADSTNTLEPMIYDENYQHSGVLWSPDGSQILVQRFDLLNSDVNTRPEIWVYTPETKALNRIVTDGFYARWIPAP